jgi:hypothetical protein
MKRIIAIIIGIIIIIGGIWAWKSSQTSRVNNITSFEAQEGTLSATTKDAVTKVEVYGVLDGKKKGTADVDLGTMDLVEKNAAGDQTWVLTNTPEKRPYAELFVKAFGVDNKEVGTRSLAIKGKDAITGAVWPSPKQTTIYGLVRELSGNTLRLSNGGPRTQDIVVSLDPTVKIFDTAGKLITRSRLTKDTKIAVTGNFTNELAFKASQIELGKF